MLALGFIGSGPSLSLDTSDGMTSVIITVKTKCSCGISRVIWTGRKVDLLKRRCVPSSSLYLERAQALSFHIYYLYSVRACRWLAAPSEQLKQELWVTLAHGSPMGAVLLWSEPSEKNQGLVMSKEPGSRSGWRQQMM